MNEIDVNRVLSQIRAMQGQIGSARPAAATPAAQGAGFDGLLRSALQQVNGAQQESARLQQAFQMGDPGADLASVMLAGAKAQVGFKAAVEVRNRLVSAYQEIMNMPL